MDYHDISLLLRSHAPILTLETHEELRAIDLLQDIASDLGCPLFRWSITSGMQRLDLNMDPQNFLKEPGKVLDHIISSSLEAIYLLLDFHPFLKDPVIIRQLKESAFAIRDRRTRLVLISHRLELPPEVSQLAAKMQLSLPDEHALLDIVRREAADYARNPANARVSTDSRLTATVSRPTPSGGAATAAPGQRWASTRISWRWCSSPTSPAVRAWSPRPGIACSAVTNCWRSNSKPAVFPSLPA